MMRPIILSLVLWIAPSNAQQAQQPAQGVAKFSTTTQLVVETVSVTDKSGNPISGLSAHDFTLTENSLPQTITFCEFQQLLQNSTTPAKPTGGPPLPSVRPTTRTKIASEAPGSLQYRDRRLLVLYFDMTSMPVADQIRAQSAALQFIQTQMASADLLALMSFSGGNIHVLQDFTDDRDRLTTTIRGLIVGEGRAFEQSTSDDSTSDTGLAFTRDDSEFNIFNTDHQLAGLQSAATMLGHLNEKKSLIYFSSGLMLSGVDNQAQLQATTNAAIRANVSLYPIDARGLLAQAPLGNATAGSPGGIGMYSGSSALAETTNVQKSKDTLYALAEDTGGKALLDYNDLTVGIVQAQQATSSYYILGYYTTNGALDGRFRRIKIALVSKTGSLAYRQGYYAGKDFGKFTSADKERQLEDALMLGDPVTDLTIRMEIDYFRVNASQYFVPVAVRIPGTELTLARRSGAQRTSLEFIGEVKNGDFTVKNLRDKKDIKLTGESADQLSQHPIQYDTGFMLSPGSYALRFLARENETGRMGTYIAGFTIPNVSREDEHIPISSVVLSSQRIKLGDALSTAGANRGAAVNPLIQDRQQLLPNVTRVFRQDQDLYVYLQAYEPEATVVRPLLAFVTFFRGPEKAFETPPLPVAEGLNPISKAIPLAFTFPLNQVLPGRYRCQVTVLDPERKKMAFWEASIVIIR